MSTMEDEFNLAETFAIFQKDPSELCDRTEVSDPEECLDLLTDSLTFSPEAITDTSNFNDLKILLLSYNTLPSKFQDRILDIIKTGLQTQVKSLTKGIENHDIEALRSIKPALERYSFLLHWLMVNLEILCASSLRQNVSNVSGVSRRQAASNKSQQREETSVIVVVEAACTILRLNLKTLYATSSELSLFTSLFLRPCFQFLENDQLVKITSVRMYLFKTICLCVKIQQQTSSVQMSMMQQLIYFEHLAEPLAELLHILFEQYDTTQLTDDILKELATRDFNANDNKGPKSVSLFLIRLSQLIPHVVLKQMTVVVRHLDSESFSLRCAVIEAVGNLVLDICKNEEDMELHQSQISSLLDLVEERVLDLNPYCRCRALQVLSSITE